MEYSQLYKRYYSTIELSGILCVAKNVVQNKLRRVARKQNSRIHVKTEQCGSGVRIFYKLKLGEYQREYICDDAFVESVVDFDELKERCCKLGNRNSELVSLLFDSRDRYLTYDEISEITGIRRIDVANLISGLEYRGLVFHRRNMKTNREIKLVSISHKRQRTKMTTSKPKPTGSELLNKVFR